MYAKKFYQLIPTLVVAIALSLSVVAQLPDSIHRKIQLAKSPIERFDAWYNAMSISMQTGDLKTYQHTTINMLAIATEEKSDSLFMRAYSATGFLFILKGDYKPGIEFMLKAMHLAEELKDYKMLCVVYNNLGQAYLDLSNYTEALKYTSQILPYSLMPTVRKTRPDYVILQYINISEIFLKLNRPDSALRSIQSAQELLLSYQSQQGRLSKEYLQNNLLMNFGMMYEKLEENDLAENYYRKSIANSESQNFQYPLAQNTDKYGNFLFRQNRFADAKEAALKCLHASQSADYKKGIIAATDILRKVYFKLNHADSAYFYANINVNYRDTVYNEQKLNQLQDMTFTEQIRQTEEIAKRKDEQEKHRQNIETAAIGIGIIVFIILFLLYSNSVIASPWLIRFLGVIVLLATFEFLYLLLDRFLADFTHESTLWMLLVWVVLGALLAPLDEFMDHWVKHKLVEKNKAIRIAAAHKTLEKLEGETNQDTHKEVN